jgi:hypothetical protein
MMILLLERGDEIFYLTAMHTLIRGDVHENSVSHSMRIILE